jgi:hypothetical protein
MSGRCFEGLDSLGEEILREADRRRVRRVGEEHFGERDFRIKQTSPQKSEESARLAESADL